METSFDILPCGYVSFDDSGKIVDINEPLCVILGYEKNWLLSQKIESIFPVSTKIFFQTHLYPLLKMQGFAEEIFVYILAKDSQQIPVLLSATHSQKQGVGVSKCVCIVVNNRKKYEDEILNAKKIAELALSENTTLIKAKDDFARQAESLEEKVQIITTQNSQLREFNKLATHDLQEPLRKILLFIDLLRRPGSSDKQDEYLEKIEKAASSMRNNLNGLQQYIELNEATVHPTWVNIGEIIRILELEFNSKLGTDSLVLNVDNLPTINGDQDQLHELFYHLLKNVVDYKKPGEKAVASIKGTVLKLNRYKTLEKYDYIDFLRITITDEGVGFATQNQNQIFSIFNKLQNHTHAGLGLSYCKLIVEKHGGFIEVESTPDKGTIMVLNIPMIHPKTLTSNVIL